MSLIYYCSHKLRLNYLERRNIICIPERQTPFQFRLKYLNLIHYPFVRSLELRDGQKNERDRERESARNILNSSSKNLIKAPGHKCYGAFARDVLMKR